MKFPLQQQRWWLHAGSAVLSALLAAGRWSRGGREKKAWGLSTGIPAVKLGTWESQVDLTVLGQAHFKCFLNKTVSNHFPPCPSGFIPLFCCRKSVIFIAFCSRMERFLPPPWFSVVLRNHFFSSLSLCSTGLVVHFFWKPGEPTR